MTNPENVTDLNLPDLLSINRLTYRRDNIIKAIRNIIAMDPEALEYWENCLVEYTEARFGDSESDAAEG